MAPVANGHWMAVIAGAQLISPGREFGPVVSAAVVAALFGVSLGLAWALHSALEIPLTRRFGRHSGPGSQQGAADRQPADPGTPS